MKFRQHFGRYQLHQPLQLLIGALQLKNAPVGLLHFQFLRIAPIPQMVGVLLRLADPLFQAVDIIALLLDFYGDMLTEKQRDVVELYYNEDLSLAEIASHSGITRQGVRDSIKRAEGQLLDCEGRLHLAERFRRIQRRLDEITDLARDIERVNDRFGASNEIYSKTKRIITLAGEIRDAE